MIDKQKLLQWVEDELDIASGSHSTEDSPEWIAMCKAEAALMYKLKRLIEFGNFDVEEVAHERTTASSASASRT